MTKVLQWNCRSIRNKKQEIIYLSNQYNPVLFAVAESWLRPDTLLRVPGFSCLRDDRDDGWAGTAILVRRNISFSRITLPPHSSAINIVAVRCFNITVVSVYIPHPNSNLIQEFSTLLTSLPCPLLVLGDFNIRHTMWGSELCDSNSSLFLDKLDELNLCLLNDGTPTRRVSPSQSPSAPDLSLSSPSLVNSISWSVLSNSHGSDHLPILLTLADSSIPSSIPYEPLLKFRLNKADWQKYSSLVQNNLESLPDANDENTLFLYLEFCSILSSAAELTIPLKNSASNKIPSPAWWDAECSQIVQKRKEAESEFSKILSLENFLEFQKISAISKRFLRQKKSLAWRNFCESLSPRTPASLIWKKIKAFRKSQSDNNINSNSLSWLPDFISKLCPPFVPFKPCPLIPSSASKDPMNSSFSFAELCCVLDNLRDSAPGIDGFPYSFIKKLSDSSKKIFLNLLNHIFLSSSIPASWKTQLIIPILKPGKDPAQSCSYRPIALSSVLAKIMEHLIKNRLEWIVENRSILPNSQFGFRRGYGTLDSLSLLTSDIRVAFSQNRHVIAVFLDISSAYDNVDLHLLRQKLINLNMPPRIVNFIFNLFYDRSIIVRILGENSSHRTWKGLPQGSVLSPLLYNIYTAILDTTVNRFCRILQYADDIALYTISNSFSQACNCLNSALFNLNSWLNDHCLSLSIPKCSAVAFSRKRVIPEINIEICNQSIPVLSKVKFLGILLDSKLSGVHHLNYICNKVEKSINVLRALSGVKWGSHPYSQKLLYNALIRSHFDYGCFVLEPCNKMALTKLNRIQSKCLRIISGAMKSSPINALQVECFEPPLALRRQFLADRFFYKVISLSNHPLLALLSQLAQLTETSRYWRHKSVPPLVNSYKKLQNLASPISQYDKFPLFLFSFDCLLFRPTTFLNIGIHKDSPGANLQFQNIVQLQWPNHYHLFTDASKLSQNGLVGAAVWIPKFKISLKYKLPQTSSVYSGEAVALLEAALFIKTRGLSKSVIFSDSLSCLQDITKFPSHSKVNFEIILKIKETLFQCHCSGLDVTLVWIPSHSGICGNELADSCAKEAVVMGCNKYNKIFPRDLHSLAKSDMLQSWNESWQISRQSVGKHYGNLQPTLPSKPWFSSHCHLPKKIVSAIIRLRLGHVCSPVFLAKIRVRDHSLCECGLDEGTLDHIFFDCPNIVSPLYDILPNDIPRPININCLLTLVYSKHVNILCKFLSANNIYL